LGDRDPQAIVLGAALGIPEHLPGGIEGQDRVLIAASIGVVLLHQGAIRRLDLSAAGVGMHPQHLVGIGVWQTQIAAHTIIPGPVVKKKPPPKRGWRAAA
jgi:hypothetical protein